MKPILSSYRLALLLVSFMFSLFCHAMDSKSIEKQANRTIEQLYHRLNTIPNTSIATRIEWFSAQFISAPYFLGALGEGPKARYDQYPRYRTDVFDCDTYVNTVLALAIGSSLESFQQCMKQMRYQKGIIGYLHRNHFTSIDWNTNNQKKGFLKDITCSIKNKQSQSVAVYAYALINKPGWYEHKNISTIRLQNQNQTEQIKRLEELKNKGKSLNVFHSKVPYIPISTLLPKNKPDNHLLSQIPNGSIIEIVRPNWNLKQQIGTALNISHLGFAIWIKKQLFFRQASSLENKVIDVPLIEYLKNAQKSPTIKGINIQLVIAKENLKTTC